MEKIIDEIIGVEQKAQELVRECRKQQKDFEKNMREEIENLKKEYHARADERLLKVEESEREFFEQSVSARQKSFARQMSALDGLSHAKSKEWSADIFKKIIKKPAQT